MEERELRSVDFLEQKAILDRIALLSNCRQQKVSQACKIATYNVIKSTVVGWERLVQSLQKGEPGLYI